VLGLCMSACGKQLPMSLVVVVVMCRRVMSVRRDGHKFEVTNKKGVWTPWDRMMSGIIIATQVIEKAQSILPKHISSSSSIRYLS